MTERLWKLAEGLPVEPVPIDSGLTTINAVRFTADPNPDYYEWNTTT